MEHEFWHACWENNRIGFHQPEVNKLLVKYWPKLVLPKNKNVFVPLCGKSLDLIWFYEQGYQVVGVELSLIALKALMDLFESKYSLSFKRRIIHKSEGKIELYTADKIRLFCGDVFQLNKELLGQIDGIYDRAALVALPPNMRKKYCTHIINITESAPQLLFAFNYSQNKMAGPPFSVPEHEIKTHYKNTYTVINVLESRELIDKSETFKQRGLSSFQLQVYQLARA